MKDTEVNVLWCLPPQLKATETRQRAGELLTIGLRREDLKVKL